MRIGTFIAIYFVVWWIVLFAVLPWGMHTQEEEGEVTVGTPASAPANLRLVQKAVWTTIVSAILVAVVWGASAAFGLSLDRLVDLFGMSRQ